MEDVRSPGKSSASRPVSTVVRQFVGSRVERQVLDRPQTLIVREEGIERIHQIDEQRLARLRHRITEDRDTDNLRDVTGSEGQATAGGGVVTRIQGGVIGRGVDD